MRLGVLAAVVSLGTACGPGPETGDCTGIVVGDLVISEVFADFAAPAGAAGMDEGKEWFEIYNATDEPLELRGITLTHSKPDGTSAKTHLMKERITIDKGRYLTFGNSASDLLPPYIDYGYAADLGDMSNTTGGILSVSCGETKIDEVSYDSVKSGYSRELSSTYDPPDSTINDVLDNWCNATIINEFEGANYGTPGAPSDCRPVLMGKCEDFGTIRAVVPAGPGDLVITEVMPDPEAASDSDGEWFEAKVMSDVDLNGLGLDRAGDTSKPNVIQSPDCVPAQAGDYVVFAKKDSSQINGGLPEVKGIFTFSLVSGTVDMPGDVRLVVGEDDKNVIVIDAITWTSADLEKAHSLQLDFAKKVDPVVNDERSNFCSAPTTKPYGDGDFGTPATDNAVCKMAPKPGECDDGGTIRAIVKPNTDDTIEDLVITEIMSNPVTEGSQEWVEVTNVSGAAFDLNELGIDRDNETTERPADLIDSAECKSLAPGAFAVFAQQELDNGGLPKVDATYGFNLPNSGATKIKIWRTKRDAQGMLSYVLLDEAPVADSSDGTSLQLKGTPTTGANDNATNFCQGTTSYGGGPNKGTPGAANDCP